MSGIDNSDSQFFTCYQDWRYMSTTESEDIFYTMSLNTYMYMKQLNSHYSHWLVTFRNYIQITDWYNLRLT